MNICVGIINYNSSNINSIVKVLKLLDYDYHIISKLEDFENIDRLILPGIGKYDSAINTLKKANLFEKLNEMVIEKKIPILGICLGMQLMLDSSEEGGEKGFSWINGENLNLNKFAKITPHIGFNKVGDNKYYFSHSFYPNVCDEFIVEKVFYYNSFPCFIKKENIFGVQFHPEKSGKEGILFIKNFLEGKL